MNTTTHLLATYPPQPLTLVRGQGTRVWDNTGRPYLDFCTGIATNALGHAHPHWVDTLHRQAATLAHTSNLYHNEPQERLAQHLNTRTNAGPGKLFFCNSGTEANEALIKLARLHGRHKAGGQEGRAHKIIVAAKAFHGRTCGAMSATPQEKIQNGYRPLLDGFVTATLNDLDSFARHMDEHTAAVLLEVIQGEGGLTAATPDFLHALRTLCTQRNILLLLDEVQTGAGRTGKYLAYQHHHPLPPDAYSLAKGLAGGFPIGAI